MILPEICPVNKGCAYYKEQHMGLHRLTLKYTQYIAVSLYGKHKLIIHMSMYYIDLSFLYD